MLENNPVKYMSFLSSVRDYLTFLDNTYKTNNENTNERSSSNETILKLLKLNDLSQQIKIIKTLPDLNNPVLKNQKEKIILAIIDLNILKNTQNTVSLIKDTLDYNLENLKHTALEKWFNALYNGSQLILKFDNNIYNLELNTDLNILKGKGLETTYYNFLPNEINGTLKLWDMKISIKQFQALEDISSDDETDAENQYDINQKEELETYHFSSKLHFIEILKQINNMNYTTYYNL